MTQFRAGARNPPCVIQHDASITITGEALPMLYRAVIALAARHHRDGLSSPPLLHTLRKELFRATTMSPPRHKDAGHTIGSTQSNGQGACDWLSVGEAAALLSGPAARSSGWPPSPT